MASLKEIKGRISSVESTLKITSAMKMVASAKLHKAQQAIEGMLPYDRQLHRIMTNMLSVTDNVASPLCTPHDVKTKRVAIIAIASNGSLCGGYNSNVLKLFQSVLNSYKDASEVTVYDMGRKLDLSLLKLKGFKLSRDYVELGDNPRFSTAQQLAMKLMEDYSAGKIDEVRLVYMHFKNTASQIPTQEIFLPLQLDNQSTSDNLQSTVYTIEPTPSEVLKQLIPDALSMKIFTVMLDAQAAEHAARTVAMQTATDNANELLDDLRILYNKGRQSAITAELLDIVGGSMN